MNGTRVATVILLLMLGIPGAWLASADGRIRWALEGRHRLSDEELRVAPIRPGAYDWVGEDPLLAIAHGLGPHEGTVRNSLPTFRRGLERGFRVFEVDLTLTADERLVCYHPTEEEDADALTYDEYRRWIEAAGSEPCVFEDLVEQAEANPEIRFVLDVKNRFEDAYAKIRGILRTGAVSESFIPQLYDYRQLDAFRSDPLFAGAIFTSYQSPLMTETLLAYARRTGVRVVTLTRGRVETWKGPLPEDLIVLTHPVTDPLSARDLRLRGVDGIYTSVLGPTSAPDLYR